MADDSTSRRLNARRTVLGLAAAIILVIVVWFVVLVVLELNTERRLNEVLSGNGVTFVLDGDDRMSFEEAVSHFSEMSGITLDVDWDSVVADRTVAAEDMPRPKASGAMPPNSRASYRIIRIPRPTFRIGNWFRFTNNEGHAIVSSLSFSRPGPALDHLTSVMDPRATWQIEGGHVVIMSAEDIPQFDASGAARRWWHKAMDWWGSL